MGLVDFYIKALTRLRPRLSLYEVQRLAASATTVGVEYGKAHPYRAAFTVVGVGLTPILGSGKASGIDRIWTIRTYRG